MVTQALLQGSCSLDQKLWDTLDALHLQELWPGLWPTASAYNSCPTKYRACPRLGRRAQSWGSCRDRLQVEGGEACTKIPSQGLCPKGSVQEMELGPSRDGAPGLPCKVQPLEFLAPRATWWRFHAGMAHKETGQRAIKRHLSDCSVDLASA